MKKMFEPVSIYRIFKNNGKNNQIFHRDIAQNEEGYYNFVARDDPQDKVFLGWQDSIVLLLEKSLVPVFFDSSVEIKEIGAGKKNLL